MVHQAFFKSKLSLIIAAALTLSACGATSPSTSQSPTNENVGQTAAAGPVVQAEEGLSARQRLAKAIKNLENGNQAVALAELEAYILSVPNSNRASNLMRQIKTPSSEYFPSSSFSVTLRSGQSLSTLAKKYLGSAWEFYALAKYNDIDNPSRVNIGSEIKIPLTQLARSVKAKEETLKTAATQAQELEQATEDVTVALDADEFVDDTDAGAQVPTPALEPIITKATITDALVAANSKGDFAESVDLLESLKGFGPLSAQSADLALVALKGHASSIMASDPVTAANLYSEAAQLDSDKGNQLAAFEGFKKAMMADGNNTEVNTRMLELQKSITDKYHREASTAFRQQALKEAIQKWDIVLSVDPNHSNAMAYRTQAIELQERLMLLKQE